VDGALPKHLKHGAPRRRLGPAEVDIGRREVVDAPACTENPFQGVDAGQRSFGTCTISRREAKAVAKLTKSKLNDVVTTVSGGAVRRYPETWKALAGRLLQRSRFRCARPATQT
jgi:hypothetical protein